MSRNKRKRIGNEVSSTNSESSIELNEMIRVVETTDPELLKSIPPDKRREVVGKLLSFSMTRIEQIHKGPLPPPEQLALYEEIIPDGANRIMKMAEMQLQHRHEIESKAISSQLNQSGRGQIFGLTIGLTTILCGTLCILMGHEWAGVITSGTGLTGLVSVFVYGKRRERAELNEKK
jgi:uncharacterized membrane protein